MANSIRLLIKNGTLIDGSGDGPVPNKLIVVDGNRITAVGGPDGPRRHQTFRVSKRNLSYARTASAGSD
jgi:hypothetical protein